jgi:hypothetical protein
LLDILVADLRYALRIFRRCPGFAATAVVSLAVGIAAATGLFSLVNAALLNRVPICPRAAGQKRGALLASKRATLTLAIPYSRF